MLLQHLPLNSKYFDMSLKLKKILVYISFHNLDYSNKFYWTMIIQK